MIKGSLMLLHKEFVFRISKEQIMQINGENITRHFQHGKKRNIVIYGFYKTI